MNDFFDLKVPLKSLEHQPRKRKVYKRALALHSDFLQTLQTLRLKMTIPTTRERHEDLRNRYQKGV